MSRHTPPFSADRELCHDINADNPIPAGQHLPGYPSVSLSDSNGMSNFLRQELWAKDLEAVAARLWILTTPSGANIRPLHKQKVLGREVVVTEDPGLHLAWVNDRIFIKPLPPYLLSHKFWTRYLLAGNSPLGVIRSEIQISALGFLRTYRYLIQHESDLLIAQQDQHRLIPPDIDWRMISLFLTELDCIQDRDVSQRYQYGELRLSRLNLYAPLLFHRSNYEHIPMQYGQYFARLYGPVLFVFAIVTTILNTMQVAIAAYEIPSQSVQLLWKVFYWFSIVALLLTAVAGCFFMAIWAIMVAEEWRFALKSRFRR